MGIFLPVHGAREEALGHQLVWGRGMTFDLNGAERCSAASAHKGTVGAER